MSERNLELMFERADDVDFEEGKLAYFRYNELMQRIARKYNYPLARVVAAFVSLSPNSDYTGNLRSLISLLEGIAAGVPCDQITVSTYKHCRDRAHAYVLADREFLKLTHGQKVLSFYHNVMTPEDNRYVTVDGHVVAAWRGQNLTMNEAILRKKRDYVEIADAIKRLAFRRYLLPNQYQAVLWFARKRSLGIRYDPRNQGNSIVE